MISDLLIFENSFWMTRFFLFSEVNKNNFSLPKMNFQTRGRSQTTWTNFWPILTPYLPIVDFGGHLVHYLPLVHVDIEKPDHLPPMYNMYLVLQLLMSRRSLNYNFQVFSGLLTNPINIHIQKIAQEMYNRRIL